MCAQFITELYICSYAHKAIFIKKAFCNQSIMSLPRLRVLPLLSNRLNKKAGREEERGIERRGKEEKRDKKVGVERGGVR